MMNSSVPTSSPFKHGLGDATGTCREGQISSKVAWHYASRKERFIYISSKIDEALHTSSRYNFDFAWGLLAELSPDLLNLRGYLFGSESKKMSANLECAYMVLNKPLKGRLPKKKPEYLQLADRYMVIRSWSKLARHNCEGKEVCNCIKSTRREVRRVIKYVESLDAVWEDVWDLAYIEENLFPFE